MSTFTRVQNAKNPQDAMAALAHGIDAILAKLGEKSSWGDMENEWSTEGPPVPDAYKDDKETTIPINLADADMDDPRVADAVRRLMADKNEALQVQEDRATQTWETQDGTEVEIPQSSQEQQDARLPLAEQLFPDHADMKEAYCQGGPGWLYIYDRDFVMSLPDEIKRQMVADWEQISTTEAQEMGRDILKDTEVQGAPSVWEGATPA